MSEAREAIMQRIREALPDTGVSVSVGYANIRRNYNIAGTLPREALLSLLIDRLRDYEANIYEVQDLADISTAVGKALAERDERSVLAGAGFPEEWLPAGVEVVRYPQARSEITAHTAVITTCELAVASTGTIVLVHEGAQGGRVLTLLPDHHICVLRRDQIVETVPEAFDRVASRVGLPITTISGPSATSDIEMTRIRGVHGPRWLSVILYG